MDETTSLWALFASSFLAATVLPGGSELVLYAVLKLNPETVARALAVATLGNTLGGLSSYAIGRLIPHRTQPVKDCERAQQAQQVNDCGRSQRPQSMKGITAIQRYGAPVLLFSWVPLIGDALCVAAGWLRLNPFVAAFYMALGKFARYLLIAFVA